MFEERPVDPAGRRAALAAAVEQLAARTHHVRPLTSAPPAAASPEPAASPGPAAFLEPATPPERAAPPTRGASVSPSVPAISPASATSPEPTTPAVSPASAAPAVPASFLAPAVPLALAAQPVAAVSVSTSAPSTAFAVSAPSTISAPSISSAAPSAGRDPIALLEPLAALVPGGVRRGEALSLAGARHPSGVIGGESVTVDYLALALLAGALRQGLWCAAVGASALGGAALAGLLGAHAVRAGALQRLLVVPEPGERWAEVSAVLADGVDLVLLSPPEAVSPQVARRVDARLRQGAAAGERHRAALLVLGPWPSARAVLRVDRLGWSGLGAGTGRLLAGEAVVTAEDRTRRVRTARVWLPADEGGLAPASAEPAGAPASTGAGLDESPAQARRLTAVA